MQDHKAGVWIVHCGKSGTASLWRVAAGGASQVICAAWDMEFPHHQDGVGSNVAVAGLDRDAQNRFARRETRASLQPMLWGRCAVHWDMAIGGIPRSSTAAQSAAMELPQRPLSYSGSRCSSHAQQWQQTGHGRRLHAGFSEGPAVLLLLEGAVGGRAVGWACSASSQ